MPAERIIAISPVESARRQRRILVADDNRDAGETLAMLLRLDGHDVHVATDGLEAIEMFARLHPEVAILDIGMPGLSGHEVARRIRDEHSEHPVTLIAITGGDRKPTRIAPPPQASTIISPSPSSLRC